MEKKPPKDSVIINIHVTPNKEVAQKCVAISQSLKSDGTMFVLDGVTKFPHMTVFMFRVAVDHIPNVIQAVQKGVADVKSFPCNHIGDFMTDGRYFEVSYEKTAEFVALHEKLIAALKDLRINPGNPYEEGYFTPYNEAQQKNAKETGYDLAHELFRPHITLTRYKEGMVPEQKPQIPQTGLSFPLGKMCIYKADENGAVYEMLAEFSV